MTNSLSKDASEKNESLDKFISMTHNNPTILKFIELAVQTFDAKKTAKLTLHVQNGVAKGGDANFSF